MTQKTKNRTGCEHHNIIMAIVPAQAVYVLSNRSRKAIVVFHNIVDHTKCAFV